MKERWSIDHITYANTQYTYARRSDYGTIRKFFLFRLHRVKQGESEPNENEIGISEVFSWFVVVIVA